MIRKSKANDVFYGMPMLEHGIRKDARHGIVTMPFLLLVSALKRSCVQLLWSLGVLASCRSLHCRFAVAVAAALLFSLVSSL